MGVLLFGAPWFSKILNKKIKSQREDVINLSPSSFPLYQQDRANKKHDKFMENA